MRAIVLAFFLALAFSGSAQVNIIPQPVEVKLGKGNFNITKQTVIAYDDFTKNAAYFLRDYLNKTYGLSLQLTMHNRDSKKAIWLMSGGQQEKKGFYELKCDDTGIFIAGDDEGVFSGTQTLIQLLPATISKLPASNLKLSIPQLLITDYPRFAYRGMHLDVSRHFFPVSFIKKYIDYLAYHKFNNFHWHLTDDQGWRIEIKKYPKLTTVGGWRNGTIIGGYPGTGNDEKKYGGFYTQAEIKEVVKYAADRYITIIPEIEMPGHGSAAIAAYPQLSCFPKEPTINYFPKQCKWNGDSTGKQVQQTWGVFDDVFCAGNETTFSFLEDVMKEVMVLFPSRYIHVGGDECPKTNWKKCPACQKRMADNKLKDEHELQSYFIQRMEKFLNSNGRTLIGWDEILEGGLAPNAAVMSWRGEQGGIDAAKQKHKVIMTPGNPVYFDHTQSENEDSVTIGGFNPVEKVYAYEPIPKELSEEEGKYILGAQANLWTEYIKNTKKVEYMVFPRMSALSEVLWSTPGNRNWEEFQRKLLVQFKRYDQWKANYSKAYFQPKTAISPASDNNGVVWTINHKYDQPAMIRFDARNRLVEKKETIPPYNRNDIINITRYVTVDTIERQIQARMTGTDSITIKRTGYYSASVYKLIPDLHETTIDFSYPIMTVHQVFSFNKATGKKITLIKQADSKYPGEGAFTLVNGVINSKGYARSNEFLGFSGDDCEAIIDLGKEETIKSVKINFLDQRSSWIYPPGIIDIYLSSDGIKYEQSPNEERKKEIPGTIDRNMSAGFYPLATARYIKVVIKNFGTIPEGNPGAGSKAWLFVDEIEVN